VISEEGSERRIIVFDTTLRDGDQAPGMAMSIEQKIEVFRLLQELEIDIVEAGFPASSREDFEAARLMAQERRRGTISVFARANTQDIDRALDAVRGCNDFQLQILAVGSEIHLERKRKITAEVALQEAADALSYARAWGVEDLSIGIEDASRGSYEYLRRMVETGLENGATTVAIGDTVAAALPHEFGARIAAVRSWAGPGVTVSTHCHDDMGLATANTLAGIHAGADSFQGTLCGIGERAGNVALEQVVAALSYRADYYGGRTRVDTRRLFEVCRRFADVVGCRIPMNKPIVGRYVFSTAAGLHQHGIANDPATYEYLVPDDFGRERELVLSRHSGRAAIRYRLQGLGHYGSAEVIERMYQQIMRSDDIAAYNSDEALERLFRKEAPCPEGHADRSSASLSIEG
jgi:2-isopropylmalate synthase